MLTLRDAMAEAARALSRSWYRAWPSPRRTPAAGRVNWIFTLRLMTCVGTAGLVRAEVLPLPAVVYWVPLTVAIVFKPDYGSVFARALQRGIGTVVGAVAGAALLVLVHGAWLLIPFAVLAALLPFGRSRNYGLLAAFLTPLVVVLIDLLSPGGWRLAEDRLIDTLIGCAIVLLIRFAPWPISWYSHLPRQYARTALDVFAGTWRWRWATGTGPDTGCRAGRGRRRPGRGCGGPPTGPWPTCGPSSSAPCPSRRRSVGARPPGGLR